MSDILACARARNATDWLFGFDPGDGRGTIAEEARDPAALFTQPVVISAFVAGADQAEAEFAIERTIGQQQLDDATALIMEAAALFIGYADHHRARADEATEPEVERASLKKAEVNLLMAIRLKEWLAGSDRYSVSCPPAPFAIPAEIADNGDLVPSYAKEAWRINITVPDGEFRPAPEVEFRAGSNVKRLPGGPLADPDVVEGLMAAAGMIDAAPDVKGGAFRLHTPDPRFDPTKPVTVNGYLYTPATEA